MDVPFPISGPMDLRFKRSVANAVRNLVEKERNHRRLLPTISIGREFEPGGVTDLPARSSPSQDEKVIDDFRRLVRQRLGDLGAAVLDVRLAGGETKSLVGSPSLGNPGRWTVKRVVQEIKALAREFFAGDPELLRRVERALRDEAGGGGVRVFGPRQERRPWGMGSLGLAVSDSLVGKSAGKGLGGRVLEEERTPEAWLTCFGALARNTQEL